MIIFNLYVLILIYQIQSIIKNKFYRQIPSTIKKYYYRQQKFSPSALVLECIVKHIIPLYIHVMDKANSFVIIHYTSNVTKPDDFQFNTIPRLELPLLRIITVHINFSSMKNNKGLYKQKFRVYSKSLSKIINHLLIIYMNT